MKKLKAKIMDRYRRIFSFNTYNRDQWVAAQAACVKGASRVLDVGAGTGPYRSMFAHCEYRSHDFAQEPGTIGKYTQLDYISDVTAIPVANESFDVILCTEVLEHVSEPIEVIKEFSRIIRNGGKLLLTAPLGSGIHQQPFFFYGGYSPYWYEHFLKANGFDAVKVVPNCGFFKHYGQESQRFLTYLFPSDMPMLTKILSFPIKLILAAYFRILMPLFCHYLDRFDKDRHFTVGFFIEATKVS